MEEVAGNAMFQFTLPRGERLSGSSVGGREASFNSRSREGSDKTEALSLLVDKVSIHAPARGATMHLRILGLSWTFQFTLPRGERLIAAQSPLTIARFQFTLPRGERPFRVGAFAYIQGFQFTLPRGERPSMKQKESLLLLVSIHAPARGATYQMAEAVQDSMFQFTLPRGERPHRG